MALTPDALPDFLAQLQAMGVDHFIAPVVDRASLGVLIEEIVPAMQRTPVEV
jgi:hypothetical protein